MFVKDGELFFAEFGKVEDCREDFFDSAWIGFNQIADGEICDADLSHQQDPNVSTHQQQHAGLQLFVEGHEADRVLVDILHDKFGRILVDEECVCTKLSTSAAQARTFASNVSRVYPMRMSAKAS